jgi:hypothetical protein
MALVSSLLTPLLGAAHESVQRSAIVDDDRHAVVGRSSFAALGILIENLALTRALIRAMTHALTNPSTAS